MNRMDQAGNLRNIVKNMGSSQRASRVITVTSGKGGVGKTNFTANLAIHLAKQGLSVLVIDGDFGLANIEVIFGIIPQYTLADVFSGSRRMEDVIFSGPHGIKFISGGSGFKSMANISDHQMIKLIDAFDYLDKESDVILIDTAAGISSSVTNLTRASEEIVVITTTEPTSITDAYALIKSVKEEKSSNPNIRVVVNKVEDANEGQEVFNKLNMVSQRFLSMELSYLGSIDTDNNLVRAVKLQKPCMTSFPSTHFSKSIEFIGNKLLNLNVQTDENQSGIKSFMKRLSSIFGNQSPARR